MVSNSKQEARLQKKYQEHQNRTEPYPQYPARTTLVFNQMISSTYFQQLKSINQVILIT